MDGMAIVCREVDRDSGRIAAYLVKKNADDDDLFVLAIRGRVNPELRYYAILNSLADDQEELEDLLGTLKSRSINDETLEEQYRIARL